MAVFDDLIRIVNKVPQYVPAILTIVEDPALPLIAQRIDVIRSIEAANARPSQGGPAIPTGLNLQRLVKPLDAYIYTLRNPWVPYATLGGVAFLIGAIGYSLGRR